MDGLLVSDLLVSRRKANGKTGKTNIHYHEEYELYYMLEGRTTYFIGDEIYSIERGDFVFIPKGILHMTDYNSKSNERILLSFDGELFSERSQPILEILMQYRVLHVPDRYVPELEELLLKIESEYEQNKRQRTILVELYILELLALLVKHRCEHKNNIRESDRIIYQISEYISNHFCEDICLKSLSKDFAISESYLSRKFKEVSGLGVNQHITCVRIMHAEKMLRETKYSVTEIAQRCGFCESTYFASVFKKLKGVTPTNYRKQSGVRRDIERNP